MKNVKRLLSLLLALAVAYIMLGMSKPSATPVFAVVVVMILEIIIFSILTNKAK